MNTDIATKNTSNMLSPDDLNSAMRFADMMSKAIVMLPKHFHDKPADCLAVVLQAIRWGMDPYSVASQTHIVSGNLGYQAQLVNAVISSSKAIDGRFHYEYGGKWENDKDPDSWVKVGAVIQGESDITWASLFTLRR